MLPLPVARLRRRSHNAKSSKDRHDNAYFSFEVSVKLAVAASAPADPRPLARGSFGRWVAALSTAQPRLRDGRLLRLNALCSEVVSGSDRERDTVLPREVLEGLVAYRNRVMGHGAPRTTSFYERSGRILLEALDAAWEAGLFLRESQHLVFVESVEVDSDRRRRARVLDLGAETPLVRDPGGTDVPREVTPQRLYVIEAGRWQDLHPWALFHEETERLYCFNGLGRVAEFLDYGSGDILRGDSLEALAPRVSLELRELFGSRSDSTPRTPGAEKDAAQTGSQRRFGDFALLGKLGDGGMGVVHLARQESLGRLIALKTLQASRSQDPTAVGRFQRETLAMARCDHPNVVKVLASGEVDGTQFFAMEYVDGVDLRRVGRELEPGLGLGEAFVRAREKLREDLAELAGALPDAAESSASEQIGGDRFRALARLFRDAARGLQHLHDRGIRHRDISPANVMVAEPDARVVLMDLGLAALDDASLTLTRDKSQILGTLRYLAPEHLHRQASEPDGRADLYSLAATLYELLAGGRIFDGDSESVLMKQILWEEPAPLRAKDAGVPSELDAIVHKALSKKPDERYACAADLADDLDAFLDGRPVRARRRSAAQRLLRAANRRRGVLAAAVLVAVAAVVGFRALDAARKEQTATAEELRAIIGDFESILAESAPAGITGGAGPDRGSTHDRVQGIRERLAALEQPVLPEDEQAARAFQGTRGPGNRPPPDSGEKVLTAEQRARTALEEARRALAAGETAAAGRQIESAADALLGLGVRADGWLAERLWDAAGLASELALPALAATVLDREVEVLDAARYPAGAWERILACEKLADVRQALDEADAAVAAMEQAVAGYKALGRRSPFVHRARIRLAGLLAAAGRLDDALALSGTTLEALVEGRLAGDPDLQDARVLRASLLLEASRPAEAQPLLEAAVAAWRPQPPADARRLVLAQTQLAQSWIALEQPERALGVLGALLDEEQSRNPPDAGRIEAVRALIAQIADRSGA